MGNDKFNNALLNMFELTLSNKEIKNTGRFHWWEVGLTFQTGERRRLVSRRLVGQCKIGQTETGAVVLIEIAC